MFRHIASTWPQDGDLPERAYTLGLRMRVLDGSLYDNMQHGFYMEKNLAGEYVPLTMRRPSARHNLCRVVVDDAVSLLFSEGHFPQLECADGEVRAALLAISKEAGLNRVMIDAATRGSVGSVCLRLRILCGRVFVDVLDTQYLTPSWQAEAPDTLALVREEYKVSGRDLLAQGYVAEAERSYWFRRDWDAAAERWYWPWPVGVDEDFVPLVDEERTVRHGLGFVPLVWVRNLPGGDAVDGAPTFAREAIETQIELEYQLSQVGRGLKYSSDPTLLIKDPAYGQQGSLIKGAANALVMASDGDAQLLEINGSAAGVVMEYIKLLRGFVLEQLHGNRADADRLSAASSGRAMELLCQQLVWLADRLRISYGEGALLELLGMVVRASAKFPLRLKDGTVLGVLGTAPLSLRWPAWFAPTAGDRRELATTLVSLAGAGLLSRETAVKALAGDFDVEDVRGELAALG